ncbi:hypothetical protein [Pokkaliibacter plantistimulans]|nr:hypothetical protein [Pokkaliibacter plantistimulans]
MASRKRIPVARALLLTIAAKRIDNLFNLFAVLALRHRMANPGALP